MLGTGRGSEPTPGRRGRRRRLRIQRASCLQKTYSRWLIREGNGSRLSSRRGYRVEEILSKRRRKKKQGKGNSGAGPLLYNNQLNMWEKKKRLEPPATGQDWAFQLGISVSRLIITMYVTVPSSLLFLPAIPYVPARLFRCNAATAHRWERTR